MASILRVGGWNQDACNKFYLQGWPLDAVLTAAGYDGAATQDFSWFYAPRFVVKVPPGLIALLMPWLAAFKAAVRKVMAYRIMILNKAN